jgi:hypothetical protein
MFYLEFCFDGFIASPVDHNKGDSLRKYDGRYTLPTEP